jgi:hypothetical protein
MARSIAIAAGGRKPGFCPVAQPAETTGIRINLRTGSVMMTAHS